MAAIPRQLTRIMDNARINLPGALDDALRLELFNVLDDFLKGTRLWKEEITFETEAGVTEYELSPDEDGTIISLLGVENEDEAPVAATMAVPGTLVLKNDPPDEETFTATVALTVVDPVRTDGYPRLPDWLLIKYHDAILTGLLAKMMLQQAKPYSNERMSVLHGRRFRAAIASAKSEAHHANLQNGQTWRFPRWA